MGWAAAVLYVIYGLVRHWEQAWARGGERIGPMAKQQRMALLMTATCLIGAFSASLQPLMIKVIPRPLAIVVAGCFIIFPAMQSEFTREMESEHEMALVAPTVITGTNARWVGCRHRYSTAYCANHTSLISTPS